MAEIRSVTLWELICWAYGKQRCHVLLRREGQAFEWAIAATGALEDGPRPSVAWDAAMVHGAVWEVAGGDRDVADMLIEPAAVGKRPELPDGTPRCAPVELTGRDRHYGLPGLKSFKRRHGQFNADVDPEREGKRPVIELPPSKFTQPMERNGRGRFEGRRVEVSIKTLGFEVAYRPVYKWRGRRRIQIDTDPYWHPREYCPLHWDIDPAWHAAAVEGYEAWRSAMARLWDAMKDIDLREHRLQPEEIAAPPAMPMQEFNSWTAGANEFAEVDVSVEKIARGDYGIRMFDTPTLTERRVSAAHAKPLVTA